MDLIQVIESTRFIGEEFLTWLWFRADRQDGLFTLPDGSPLELHFDDQLTLEVQLAEAEQNRLKGGSPADTPEAREALRRGKRVTKAKLRVVRDGREWTLSLDARTLGVSGVKIPAVLSSDEDDRFYERMFLIEEVDRILRTLYKSFLEHRLDLDAWRQELGAIRQWVSEPAPGLDVATLLASEGA